MHKAAAWTLYLLMIGAEFANAGDSVKVGPAIEVAPQPPDLRAQLLPDCAFDGKDTFLIVWQQGRKYYERPDSSILATRVSASGKLLDPQPIVLCQPRGSQERPRVRFAGGIFLVIWQELANEKDWDVKGARLKADGTVLDPKGIAVSAAPHSQALPDVAAGPEGFLVAWQDLRDGRFYTLYGAHVGFDGGVQPPEGTELKSAKGPLRGGQVSIVRARDVWFVSWDDETETGQLRFGRLDSNLGVLDTAPAPCTLMQRSEGRFFGNGQEAVFASSFTAGHGGGNSPAVASLWNATSAVALENPNPGDKSLRVTASGWNAGRMIVLRHPEAGAQGPVGIGYDGKKYLAVARGLQKANNKDATASHQILALRLGTDGRRIDDMDRWTLIHDGKIPAANPIVAGGTEGKFLVVYERQTAPQRRRLVAHFLEAP